MRPQAAVGVGTPRFLRHRFFRRRQGTSHDCARHSNLGGRTQETPPLFLISPTFCLPLDPHLGLGVLCGGAGGGIQQTQEPLPQPDARRRRHSDRALPAAQDRHGGESPSINQMTIQAQICPGLNAASINPSQWYSCDALNAADRCCRTNCCFA